MKQENKKIITPNEDMEVTQNIRGFMHQLNEISQAFIDFSSHAPGLVIDMGAAYGVATIPILKKGVSVIACDIEPKHLKELTHRIDPKLLPLLKTQQGYFPTDFEFENKSVGAILFSHILHFLSPEELDATFEKLSHWMAPGGKVFIVSYSPYLAVMKDFILIYEKRVAEGIRWPYWVKNNKQDFFTGGDDAAKNLPATMNYLDLPPLVNALKTAGFSIEKANYLDSKKNHISETVLLDGREWVGVIGEKK